MAEVAVSEMAPGQRVLQVNRQFIAYLHHTTDEWVAFWDSDVGVPDVEKVSCAPKVLFDV